MVDTYCALQRHPHLLTAEVDEWMGYNVSTAYLEGKVWHEQRIVQCWLQGSYEGSYQKKEMKVMCAPHCLQRWRQRDTEMNTLHSAEADENHEKSDEEWLVAVCQVGRRVQREREHIKVSWRLRKKELAQQLMMPKETKIEKQLRNELIWTKIIYHSAQTVKRSSMTANSSKKQEEDVHHNKTTKNKTKQNEVKTYTWSAPGRRSAL